VYVVALFCPLDLSLFLESPSLRTRGISLGCLADNSRYVNVDAASPGSAALLAPPIRR
jgi:hypothetical protein